MTAQSPPSSPSASSHCLNCGDPLTGRFCSRCGQSASTRALTIRTVLSDALDHIFGYESLLFRTFLELNYTPGIVARRYVDGQRKRYTNPLKYCLLAATIELLTLHVLSIKIAMIGSPDSPGILGITLGNLSPEAFDLVRRVGDFTLKYLGFFTILTLPILALFTRILSPRQARSGVAEYVALYLYVMAQCYLWQTPLILLASKVPHPLLSALIQLLPPIAIMFALIQFHRGRSPVKSGAAALGAYLAYLLTLVAVGSLAAFAVLALTGSLSQTPS